MARKLRGKISLSDVLDSCGISSTPQIVAPEGLQSYNATVRNAILDLAMRTLLAELGRRKFFTVARSVIFLGGTAARLTLFGASGRSSKDLDLNIVRSAIPGFWAIFQRGLRTPNFYFHLSTKNRQGYANAILVESHLLAPMGGSASIRVDLVQYPRVTAPELRSLLSGPMEDTYQQPNGLWLPALSVIENAAGKLCRWYRTPLVKDLHDLVCFIPYIADHIQELAEISTWIAAQNLTDRFVSTDGSGVPIFHHLEERMGEESSHNIGEGLYATADVLEYIPDISMSAKRLLIDNWIEMIFELTEQFEEAVCADDRLFAIATRSPGYEALAYELDDELHKRYGTEGNPYRRRPPEPDRSHDPTILVPGRRHGGVRSDALASNPDRPMSATDNGSTATQERCGAPTKARNGENDGPPCRRPLGESRRCPTHGYRPPT